MKSVFVCMLVAVLGLETSALAAPAKNGPSRGNVLIEMVSSGGYSAPDSAGWEHGVRVYVDGRLLHIDCAIPWMG